MFLERKDSHRGTPQDTQKCKWDVNTSRRGKLSGPHWRGEKNEKGEEKEQRRWICVYESVRGAMCGGRVFSPSIPIKLCP